MSLYQNLYRFYYTYRDFSSVHSSDLEEKQKTERVFQNEFTNYYNAFKDSKTYKTTWLKETQNNHLKLLDDRLNSYLGDHIYEYKEDNTTLCPIELIAFVLYTDVFLIQMEIFLCSHTRLVEAIHKLVRKTRASNYRVRTSCVRTKGFRKLKI